MLKINVEDPDALKINIKDSDVKQEKHWNFPGKKQKN